MKLYYAPQACSMAAHIVLRECGYNFKIEKVDLKTKTTEAGKNYLTINPKGAVPALQLDDGEVLTEVSTILQYLADHAIEAKLIPVAGTRERYRLMEWLNYIATELHKGFAPFFKDNTPAEYKKILIDKLSHHFDYLTEHLAKNMFLMGELFSVADAYLFTILRWSGFVGIELKSWPVLLKYSDHINARASVQATLHAEKEGKV